MVARRNQVTGCLGYPTSVSSFWAGVDGASTLQAKPLRSSFVVIFSVACTIVRVPVVEILSHPRPCSDRALPGRDVHAIYGPAQRVLRHYRPVSVRPGTGDR